MFSTPAGKIGDLREGKILPQITASFQLFSQISLLTTHLEYQLLKSYFLETKKATRAQKTATSGTY